MLYVPLLSLLCFSCNGPLDEFTWLSEISELFWFATAHEQHGIFRSRRGFAGRCPAASAGGFFAVECLTSKGQQQELGMRVPLWVALTSSPFTPHL